MTFDGRQNQNLGLIVSLLVSSTTALGQDTNEFNKTKWYVPRGVSTEYAGGFGMVSVGGWFEPFNKTEFSLTAGYIPPEYGDIWTTNLLVHYRTMQKSFNKYFILYPLNTGIFINVNYGDNLYIIWPSYYPKRYYEWNSAIRVGLYIEAELKYTSGNSNQNAGVFFQCLTNDLYIGTYFANFRAVSAFDILYFGTGIRYYFNLKPQSVGK